VTVVAETPALREVQPAPDCLERPDVPDGAPTPARPRQAVTSSRDWVQRHVWSIVVLSVVLAPVAVVQATGMSTYPMRFDDEGTYVSQAWSLLDRGELSPYTYWYDHPPFGWIQLAGYFAVSGAMERAETAVMAGREAMLLVHLLSSALLYVLCRRLGMARTFAVVAIAVFTFSPLALSFHRMVLLDNLAVPWLLAAFVLALTPRHRLGAYVGAAICFAGAVLTKQTMVLFLPALLYQMWQNTDAANRRYAWSMFGAMLALTAALYPLYALLSGELLPGDDHVSLVEAVGFQLGRDAVNSGQTIADWARLDHLVFVIGIAALAPAAAVRRLRPYALMGATCAAVILRPGYLPIPFVVAVFVPVAVLTAGVLDALARIRVADSRARQVPRVLTATALVVLVAWVAPQWAPGVRSALAFDQDATMRGAQSWVLEHVERDQRLLVDNAIWTDLVTAGMPEDQVVWFYKIDLDPVGVGAELEAGFREFEYVVSTQTMRDTAETLPNVKDALDNSAAVATFGVGANRVEVRQVHPQGLAREGSDREFVVDIYEDLLDRTPTRGELEAWLRQLADGEADHDEVVQTIADSDEHLSTTRGTR
jgi:fumarate reductase subunit D